MDFSRLKKIYMIGIKGVGMTMLAQFLAAKARLRQGSGGQGIVVAGSDTDETFMTDRVLKESGIKVIEGFAEKNIPKDADLIIYSTAYNQKTNPEVARALGGKTKTMTYAQALAEVFNTHFGIAVVGSHGKTTASAWLGFILQKAGLDPNVMVGAAVPQFGSTSLIGESDYLVAELDEYQNKLKYFNPRAVILTNIDYDHPDFFPTEKEYKQVFIDFIKKIPTKGFLIANWDDKITRSIAGVNTRAKVISYGLKEAADYVAYDIKSQNGKQFFKVKFGVDKTEINDEAEEMELGDFSIQLAGKHNVSNALAVIAASIELGVELRDIRTYLEEFSGAARRMEKLGDFHGATIIDDYAHHPTEIQATLKGAREAYGGKKLLVVFHPHTFTRTKALLDDFAKSFFEADELIVLDIYGSAREEQGGVHSKDLVKKITQPATRNPQQKVSYIPTLDKCEKYLRQNVKRGDVVLLMGAGDVFRIGQSLVK